MERKMRKMFSKIRRTILNEPHVKANSGGRVAGSPDSRAVRVNLPAELGGGFTMVICQLAQQPSVRSLTGQAIGMTQATNTKLLEAADWGLSLPPDEDEDPDAPRVFLHPDTLLTVILGSDSDAELDLLRLRAPKPKFSPRGRRDATQAKEADREGGADNSQRSPGTPHVQRVSSDDAQEADRWTRIFRIHCIRGAASEDREVRYSRDPTTVRSPFDPPPTPTPQHLTHVRHTMLQQLKKVQPPQLPFPPGLTCLLFPPPTSPPMLSLPSSARNRPPSPGAKPADMNSSGGKAKQSKEERRKEEDRRREREKEILAIDGLLVALQARGIGQYRAAKANRGRKGGDEDDDEDAKEQEDERERKKRFSWCCGEVEIPLFFVPLQPTPSPSPSKPKQKPHPADYAFVLTSLRALQIEGGVVTTELRIGPGSGGVISVPTTPQTGGGDGVRLRFMVKQLVDGLSNVTESGEDSDAEGGKDEDAEAKASNDSSIDDEEDGDELKQKRRRVTWTSFLLPTIPLVSYLQQYVLYMQATLTLTHALHCLVTSPSSQVTATPYRHALLGWTMLLKSFIGPLVFGPLRLPLYTHQIKQLLARVQQLQLKNVQISSLKLLQFHLPRPELTADGEEQEEDFIPSLSLRSFKGHPDHEYTFDVRWSCPSFLVRVEIQGKRVVSFKLELEMRGIEVAGCVLLRSTPYAPEKLAVSFLSLPSLSFGVSSQVVVGNVKLPFQQSIERLITTQIQNVLSQQISERAIHPQWVSVYFPKSAVSLLLDRWWSVHRFPFKFDGKDDEEMMGLALVVTTQAEQVLGETLREMRKRREEMEGYMTRPLYGEDVQDDWQAKEKLRVSEKERERELQKQHEQTGRRGGKEKKKARGPSLASIDALTGDKGEDEKAAAQPPPAIQRAKSSKAKP